MGINRTIFDAVEGVLRDYGCHEGEIRRFLMGGGEFSRRQAEAISIIEGIMTTHGKQELLHHVVELARVEQGIRQLEPWVRDHVVHALLSFLLGIHINENLLKSSGSAINPFQWKVAGLFHDVGYPAEVARDILKPFTDQINRIKQALCVAAPDVFFRIVPVGIDQLTNGANSLDLIQTQLDEWELEIGASSEYDHMVKSGRICHGIISSLSILYVIDLMYHKYNPDREYRDIYEPPGINWSQSYFENDVVPACSAIFVHNLPSRCFTSARLNRGRAPLAFLLRLSDCLQDWDRPSAGDPRGIPNGEFDIQIAGGRLVFTVASEDGRDKIAEEIASSLVASDIEVFCK
jgi:hypothetical protein